MAHTETPFLWIHPGRRGPAAYFRRDEISVRIRDAAGKPLVPGDSGFAAAFDALRQEFAGDYVKAAGLAVHAPRVTPSVPVGPDTVPISATKAPLPGWPRGMRDSIAAGYVGLSETGLRTEVRAGRVVATKLTPGRIVYLREDLDAYLDRAAGKAAATPTINEWLTVFDEPVGPSVTPVPRMRRKT